MPKLNLSGAFNVLKATTIEHLPGILTAVGVTGMVTSIIFAVRATPKAMICIEEEKEKKQVETLDPISTVKATWKCYIPTVATAALSTVCIIEGCHVNARRNAALAAAYTLSDQAFREYQQKVVETVGNKKEDEIRAEVAKDKVTSSCSKSSEVILTGKGQTLCYDSISGRKFRSDIERLKQAANELNRRMRYENYISLNEWYDEIDLDHLEPLGDDLGWHIDKGYIELEFSSILADEEPCLFIGYRVQPKHNYV